MKHQPIHTPAPPVEFTHAREGLLQSFGDAPPWPCGTPRWKPRPETTEQGGASK